MYYKKKFKKKQTQKEIFLFLAEEFFTFLAEEVFTLSLGSCVTPIKELNSK